ncbi:MAG: hypothetical protein J4473_06175 [Candidatus Aenigmarchaeota archaeon]|nr:hypothetical protein [Candidatus Aenigmarchaeota archaeon]
MELNDYLRELKNCPDDRLTGEFGISDNWPILLGTGVDRVVKDLEISGKFRLIYSGIDMSSCLTRGFNYVPGTVYMTVKQGVTKASHFDKKRLENFENRYSTTLTIQDWQGYESSLVSEGKRMEGVGRKKAIALAIEDIAGYIIEQRIPACFPWSYGHAHKDSYFQGDMSRVVVYRPEEV